MRTLLSRFLQFRRDTSANVAVIFAVSAVPIISMVGMAVDYSRANALRSKLLSAADSASVGSVGKKSPAFLAAASMTSDGVIAAGNSDAASIFNANIANKNLSVSVTSNVVKTGRLITSTVQFSASIPTMFLGVIGTKTMTVTGTSTATVNMPAFVDFYLLLDNSPSMGVAATPGDIATMVGAIGCAFACHDHTDPNNSYNKAKTLGVKTRIDTLRTATQDLMDTAASMATYTNQYRMAIYDFGADSQSIGLTSIYALSPNLSSAKTAANAIDLMWVTSKTNVGADIYTGVQNTPFTSVMTGINGQIGTPGDGSSGAPQKFLFLVSDGVGNEANTSCPKLLWPPTRCQSPINTALCDTIKKRGISIAVLYTTYLALPNDDWYNTYINPFNQGPFGPSPNSEIAINMQNCASPGYYFEVSPTDGISDAMKALFMKAVANPRLSG